MQTVTVDTQPVLPPIFYGDFQSNKNSHNSAQSYYINIKKLDTKKDFTVYTDIVCNI